MGTEALAVRKRDDDRSEFPEAVCGDLLRGDVLLEGLRVDATELAGISVGGQRVIRAGGVIAAAVRFEQLYEYQTLPCATDKSARKDRN